MRNASGILGLLAGIFGVFAAFATLGVGGIGAAFDPGGSNTVVALGWAGVFFSFLTILFGALSFQGSSNIGWMLVGSSVCGIIFGGTLVAVFMMLGIVGGILGILANRTGLASAGRARKKISKGQSGRSDKGRYVKLAAWSLAGFAGVVGLAVLIGNLDGAGAVDGGINGLVAAKEDATLSPAGELAEIFTFGSDYTDLQREDKRKELTGKVVVWTLTVFEIRRDGENYRVQTAVNPGAVFLGAQREVGTFIDVTPRSDEERQFLRSVKTGDKITVKGVLNGDSTMRSLEISPAVLWSAGVTESHNTADDAVSEAQVDEPVAAEPEATVVSQINTGVEERVLFACATENAKHMALRESGNQYQYLFGADIDNPEMDYKLPKDRVTELHGAGAHFYTLANGATTYKVFWRGEPQSEDGGVEVTMGNGKTFTIKCARAATATAVDDAGTVSANTKPALVVKDENRPFVTKALAFAAGMEGEKVEWEGNGESGYVVVADGKVDNHGCRSFEVVNQTTGQRQTTDVCPGE